MDSDPWVIPLDQALAVHEPSIGGKAWNLAQLQQAGFRVSAGFCIKVNAYDRFLHDARLKTFIQLEIGRKPLLFPLNWITTIIMKTYIPAKARMIGRFPL